MKITTLAEVEAALEPYVAAAAKTTGKGITTERTKQLAAHVGNPQKKLRVIHVAGTSGKTSTCYFVAELLRLADKDVGLTVSPHVDSIAERVQINGQPLDEQTFCTYFSDFIKLVATAPETPTYFEVMMVFALWVFVREHVDYAVVETGLGGLHDSSNICQRPDKVCVITDIGLDHQHVLGRDIASIAAQKAGIIQPDNPVLLYHQGETVDSVVIEQAEDRGGRLVFIDEPELDEVSHMPLFQQRNWQLAAAVFTSIAERDSLGDLTTEQRAASQQLHVPGRMDIVRYKGKTIILDGAHNEQKVAAFLKSVAARFPDMKPAVLLAMKAGKEYEAVVPLIAATASKVIVTRFQAVQDTPIQATEPAILAEVFLAHGFTHCQVVSDAEAAFDQLLLSDAELGIVTGSFYLVANLRPRLMNN